MDEHNNPSNKFDDLRRRAEEALERAPKRIDKPPLQDFHAVLHELQVYQSELEIQNEELRRSQEALSSLHERYFDLYDLAPAGYITLSQKGLILESNLTFAGLVGIDRALLPKQPLSDFIDPQDQDIYYHYQRQLFQSQKPRSCELRLLRRDGVPFYASLEGAIYFSKDTSFYRMIVTNIDDRKHAEMALSNAKDFAENLIETANVLVVGLDPLGRVTILNHTAERISGYSRTELFGRPWFEIVVPKARYPEVWQEFGRLPAGGLPKDYENPILTKDGRERYIVWQNSEIIENGQIVGTISFGLDITERQAAEAALVKSEARFRTFMEHFPGAVFIKGQDLRHIFGNPMAHQYCGLSETEYIGSHVTEIFPPQVAEHMQASDRQAMAEAGPVRYEYLLPAEHGREYWFQSIKFPFTGPGGQTLIGGIELNITERKLAEIALHRRGEQIAALRQIALEMTGKLDLHELLQTIISQAIKLFGASSGGIYLYRPRRDLLEWAVSLGPNMVPIGTTLQRGEGLSGKVWQRGEIMIVSNYQSWDGRVPAFDGYNWAAIMAAPIHRGEEFLGVVNILRDQPDAFTEQDSQLIEHFAAQTAIAIHNAQLYKRMRQELVERRRSEAEQRRLNAEIMRSQRLLLGLSQASQAVQRAKTTGQIVEILKAEINKMGYQVMVMRLTEDGAHLNAMHPYIQPEVAAAVKDLTGLSTQGLQFPLIAGGFFSGILEGKQTILASPDAAPVAQALPEAQRHLAGELADIIGIKSTVYAPLFAGERPFGILSVIGEGLDENVLPLIDIFAKQASISLENIQLLQDEQRARRQFRDLTNYLQAAREEERTRIAREIHDEFGQSLTALKLDLAWLRKRLPEDAGELAHKANEMDALVDDSIQTVRRVSSDLRPGMLDDLGLGPAMEWQAADFARRSQIDCRLSIANKELSLGREGDTALFRIFQEALTNIARHAQAGQVRAALVESEAHVSLTVQDDGVGFEADRLDYASALGLIGMRERARALDGDLEIISTPGEGASIIARLPKPHGNAGGLAAGEQA